MIEVQQDHDVTLVLDQALGLLQHHFGHLDVTRGGFVEGGADHLALHAARHVGDFLGPLIDQQHDQEDLGVVGGDGGGDVLQHHGLAGAGRRDDQGALALADRGDEVDDARRVVLGWAFRDRLEVLHFHLQPLIGVERRQVVEIDAVPHGLRRLEIDGVDLQQCEITLAILRRADLAFHRIAGAQAEAADLARAYIDIIRAGEVVGLGAAQEPEAVGQDFQCALAMNGLVVLGEVFQDREHHVLLA